MNYRIEISQLPQWRDARGEAVKSQIKDFLKLEAGQIRTRDVYTVSADINDADAAKIARELANPILQQGTVGETPVTGYDWLISVGFRPGVTDNVGRTAHEAIGDITGRKLRDDEHVCSSIEYMIQGKFSREEIDNIARRLLANELIETVRIFEQAELANGIPLFLPVITSDHQGTSMEYDLEVSDEDLMEISRRGVLALTLEEMKVIQNYFRTAQGRGEVSLKAAPTDVELEVLAQTWSEHCKHKIFDAEIDYDDGSGKIEHIVSCYKTFVKKSTFEIGEKVDWLVSVFHDNAGVIKFNNHKHLVYKVETHNSPSALDPYGGAMTGIVGVNRDPMGTGQGANLLINVWGYCLGSPFTADSEVPEGLLHPRRLRDGIHKGVIDGGNQSGIPYGMGWEYFDERYLGKPLVYCGTVGTLPVKIGEINGEDKSIKPGDLVVMGGGRIGKDGIHGATFSSEELHQDSPSQAVQIGDPITQKKIGDFIYEARDRGLYRFVTDNGAGGLSSSVGEMAGICNGCRMDLKKAPLKYAGLDPWEILVSEAQERMSFAVPPEHIAEFKALAEARGVEVTVLGEFTDNGKFHMTWGDKTVAYLDIDFMHNGLPRMKLKAKWQPPRHSEPDFSDRNLADDALDIVGRLNLCSNEYKARQYDHEVKGLSVIKPFIGRERDVLSDATVFMIEPLSREGVILSGGILPRYSDIDTYHMMASIIDLAIRRIIAVGGKLGHIAGLDNFCWPDPVQSPKTPDGEYKLAQLVRANQALYDYTKAFLVPCISGKDSMKNDSTRGGRKISIPPTVLFSAISKMDDIAKAVTLDAKFAGDLVYVVGETAPELGGSEYYAMLGATGNNVPKVNAEYAQRIYRAVSEATEEELVNSLHTPAIGGLVAGLAKVAMGGRLGLAIDLTAIPSTGSLSTAEALFSESNSRFIMTVNPAKAARLEEVLRGVPFAQVGQVADTSEVSLKTAEGLIKLPLAGLMKKYKETLAGI
ncbi:MAG: AIR synthase-related protein [Victivallaceae bacterium]|nr:AIR synthase-related protein [Victivallaceae bacterium]MDD3703364.1 AIR synthase-related protein [Victivallaceae bacterium]MDD4317881.1 AIR synthase-related protein [Victivallaceae bacterium]